MNSQKIFFLYLPSQKEKVTYNNSHIIKAICQCLFFLDAMMPYLDSCIISIVKWHVLMSSFFSTGQASFLLFRKLLRETQLWKEFSKWSFQLFNASLNIYYRSNINFIMKIRLVGWIELTDKEDEERHLLQHFLWNNLLYL